MQIRGRQRNDLSARHAGPPFDTSLNVYRTAHALCHVTCQYALRLHRGKAAGSPIAVTSMLFGVKLLANRAGSRETWITATLES